MIPCVRLMTTMMLAAVLCGCSVKEDRSACPSYVCVDVDEYIYDGFDQAMISFNSEMMSVREHVDLPPYEGCGYEHELRRDKPAWVSVVSGFTSGRMSGDSLMVRRGSEVDPIWLFSQGFICKGEGVRLKAIPHKQFCTLSVEVEGLNPGDEYPYSFRVIGSCCGLNIFGASAIEGSYMAVAKTREDGMRSVRMPRQKGGELRLEIFSADGSTNTSGATVYSFDLAAMLADESYDWNAEDLSDVFVTINYATAEIRLEVQPWDPDEYFSEVII